MNLIETSHLETQSRDRLRPSGHGRTDQQLSDRVHHPVLFKNRENPPTDHHPMHTASLAGRSGRDRVHSIPDQ